MSLPTGFVVRINDDVEEVDSGRVLVGGSPLRVVRLSDRARALIVDRVLRVDGPAAAVLGDRLLDSNMALPVFGSRSGPSATDLTVVIPVRDRSVQLDRALAALSGLNVTVVDDASLDSRGVAAVVRAHGSHLIQLDHNVGPAGARNIGLARVSTPYVAFVDSDVVVTADTLLGLAAHFEDPKVALVGPHVRGRAVNARPRWVERYDQSTPSLGLGTRAGVVRPGAAVAWLPGACMVGRTERLVGGFDAGMRVGEDVDLVWRLVATGERVRYDPAFAAYHDSRPTLSQWMGRKFVYGTGGAALADRHPRNVSTAVMSPSMGLAAVALLSRRKWSIPLAMLQLGWAFRALCGSLPELPDRTSLAARLSLRGLGWTLRQQSALVLRHWWPAAFCAALMSGTGRRVVASAVAVDVIAMGIEKPELPLLRTFAGRRLDDFAYGAGLWWGAVGAKSLQCLTVRWARRTSSAVFAGRECRVQESLVPGRQPQASWLR